MPRYNIYIRPIDEAKWQAIANKSEFIHTALNNSPDPLSTPRLVSKAPTPHTAPIKRTPETTTHAKICKVHGVEIDICKLMKH